MDAPSNSNQMRAASFIFGLQNLKRARPASKTCHHRRLWNLLSRFQKVPKNVYRHAAADPVSWNLNHLDTLKEGNPSTTLQDSLKWLRAMTLDLHHPLNAIDAEIAMEEEDSSQLFHHLNVVFFNGALPPTPIIWEEIKEPPAVWGRMKPNRSGLFSKRLNCKILIQSVQFNKVFVLKCRPRARMVARLGTILHEMVHVFVTHYICRKCDDGGWIGKYGHGRAFVGISRKIEEVAGFVFGIDDDIVKLGRWVENSKKDAADQQVGLMSMSGGAMEVDDDHGGEWVYIVG